MVLRLIFFVFIVNYGYGQITNLDEFENINVNALAKDELGRLWVASAKGLYCYDGSLVLKFNSSSQHGRLESDDINGLVYNEKLRKLIATTKNGVDVFDPYEYKNQLIKISSDPYKTLVNHVWNPCVDVNGNTWFANQEGYLYKIDATLKLTRFNVSVPVPLKIKAKFDFPFSINQLNISNNKIYFGTSNSLICKYDIKSGKVKTICAGNRAFTGAYEVNNSNLIFDFNGIHLRDLNDTTDIKCYSTSIINSVYRDPEGVIWFVLNKSQLFKLNNDLKTELVYEFDANKLNKHKQITSILVDNNRIWIGTSRGMIKLNKPNAAFVRILESMEGYTPVELSSRGIVGESDTTVICAGYNYLARYHFKQNSVEQLVPKDVAKGLVSYGLYLNHDSLWIASEGAGLKLLDVHSKKFMKINYRNKLLKDHFVNIGLIKCISKIDSIIFLGEYGLLGTYNLKTNIVDFCDVATWPYPWFKDKCKGINQILEVGKNEILFVSSGKLYLTNKKLKVKSKVVLTDPGNPAEEFSILNVMIGKEGNWWLSTDKGGICCYNKNTGQQRWFNTANGLCDNTVYYSLQSSDGRVWVATNFGLSVIDQRNDLINNFFEDDGLANNEFNTNSYYKAANGDLYFGGMKGITRIVPSLLSVNTSKDQFVLSSINMAGFKCNDSLYLSGLNKMKNVVLPYHSRFLRVTFSLLNYSNKNRYEFRLLGMDSAWVSLGNTNTVMFNSLEPGNYDLQIRAWNERGEMIPSMITMHINAEQVFYRKLWFILTALIGLTLLIGLVFYFIYRLKLKSINQLAEMRLKIATDLHDQVGGLLNKTATQAEIAQMKLKEQDTSLTKIADNSRVALNSMRDILWNLDPRNDSPESLVVRMSEYAQKMLEDSNYYELNLAPLKEIELSHEVRQVINTVFKEAINNIVKHAVNERVFVKAEKLNDSLIISVINTGKFVTKAELSGQGLRNMKMRIEKIGGEFKIDYQDGVKVVIIIPIK